MSAPRKGPPFRPALVAVPSPAQPAAASSAGLAVPFSAVQRCPFPRLQAFAARAKLAPNLKSAEAYELRFGLLLGLTTGREFTIELAPNMPGRGLAKILRELATAVDALADDCEVEAMAAEPPAALTTSGPPLELKCPRTLAAPDAAAPGCGWDPELAACLAAGCPHVRTS